MNQEEKEERLLTSDEDYWAKRRTKWHEWESPIGLSLGWALFIVPLGLFIELLHLAGVIK
ncbi:MAG TPA: hypothetical protein VJ579_04020 [Candidatus Paceibacterota bacterium]|nr:hypothetical protein [Candidatus Paceibacterota bacterium]